MKLEYKILWFEDDPDVINEDIGPKIRDYLQDLGFTPIIFHQINGERLDDILASDTFDLIITDLNLGEHETGDKLIDHIREYRVLTDVLLYSANTESIRNIINNKGLVERISYSVGIRNLTSKAIDIIDLTIKKFQDVNNIRGLIIAETSALDAKMEAIIRSFFNNYPEETTKIITEYISKKLIDPVERSFQEFKGLVDENDFEKIVYHLFFDATKKARVVNKIVQTLDIKNLLEDPQFVESYRKDVISPRNLFAHEPETSEGGDIILKSAKTGQSISFTEDYCIAVRKRLRKYSHIFDEVLANI